MARGRLHLPAAALLLAVLLAGCAEPPEAEVVPYLPIHETEPGRAVLVPFYVNSTEPFKRDLGLGIGDLPDGWTYRLPGDEITVPGNKGRLVVYEITPASGAAGPVDVDLRAGNADGRVIVHVKDMGAPLREGMVVNLSWVLLDANGTLLAHHEPLLKDRDGLRYAPDARAHDAPLRVRLGGEAAEASADGGDAPRLPPDVEARLLGLKVGQTLLLDAIPEGTIPAGAATPGSRLLLRVLGAEGPP